MTWWLFQSKRLFSEKAALTDLESDVDWLRVAKWHAKDDLSMCVDFEIDQGGETFAFQMIYPGVFPDAPPMIYTEDRTRISEHQYGAAGELCLEHRPDNWRPSLTGADMAVSCRNLLVEEHPDSNRIIHARSAHVVSLGRDLRSKIFRFLMTDADVEAVNKLNEFVPEALSLRERMGRSVFISSIVHVGGKDAAVWTSDLILPKGGVDKSGFVVRVPGAGKKGTIDTEHLGAFLDDIKFGDLGKTLLDGSHPTSLLMGDGDDWELFWIYGEEEERKIISYLTVRIPSEKKRMPDGFDILPDKNVGIVGCGSVGSKIAASLCRSGVRQFLLIDGDIFFPDNVVRNELGLKDTGTHKAYALKDRLLELSPLCDVKALRLSLGGQESAGSMAGALEALGKCDLIIDATAEPVAFNMIASVSKRQKKPMIWAQVFAGGIGGLVARARPDLDPVPIEARDQIEVWCADQGIDWIRQDDQGSYDGRGADGNPIIADDAAVSIIAAHATRFASDFLARPDASIFPNSAYLIGFSSEWIFNQPFHTWPIDLRPGGTWGETMDPLSPEDIVKLLKEYLPSKEGADATVTTE